MCEREATLTRNMRKEGCTWPLIQKVKRRAPGTLAKVLKGKTKKAMKVQPPGRRPLITPEVFTKLLNAMHSLQKAKNAQEEVTVEMIKRKAGVSASNRTVLDAFHKRGIRIGRVGYNSRTHSSVSHTFPGAPRTSREASEFLEDSFEEACATRSFVDSPGLEIARSRRPFSGHSVPTQWPLSDHYSGHSVSTAQAWGFETFS